MKAFVKSTNLPPAPEPTRTVRTKTQIRHITADNFKAKVTMTERQKRMNTARRGNWNDDEVNTLMKMHRAGYDYEVIARHLPNRTEAAVAAKIRKLLKKGEL